MFATPPNRATISRPGFGPSAPNAITTATRSTNGCTAAIGAQFHAHGRLSDQAGLDGLALLIQRHLAGHREQRRLQAGRKLDAVVKHDVAADH